ncbi:tetratricopeptide repeat protein [Pannus brasiliensis CCIBt3594]|uniref:Tetratricopeptide repeat protein n=1 Tax=Pannus brasiliensis CCIBt3594 TaxID=1427578 RepID=A0AAW9QS31_9CHRO
MDRKNVKIGFRKYHKPLIVGSIISLVVISPFAVFYLLSVFYLHQGDRLLQEGKTDEAIAAYETVLAFNGNSDRAYVNIARALQRENKHLEALEAYNRAFLINPNLKLDRTRSTDLLTLGDALGKGENWLQAIEAYQKAIAIDPNSDKARFQLGVGLYNLQRWDDAAKTFAKAIELAPRQGKAYYYLGESYSQQKLWENASSAYQSALQFDPDNAKIFQRLGESLQEQGKWAEAGEIYLQAIARNPKDGDSYNRLGKALTEQGKVNEAIVIFQQALQISPKNAGIRENLCYSHLILGQVDEGLNWCRRAIELDPNLTQPRFIMQEVQRGRLIHDNPKLLEMPERIPSIQSDPLIALKRSIVKIVIRERGKASMGTGWVVKRDNDRAWIVTNRHVIANSRQETDKKSRPFVEFYSDPPPGQIRKRSRAKILHATPPDDWLDVAVLEVKDPPKDIRPLELAAVPIASMEPVKSIGNPFNQKDWTVTKGVVNDNTEKSLNMSMLVVSGQSGSPVFNQQNQVVGMISQSGLFCPAAPATDSLVNAVKLGCGLAIPIDRVRKRLIEWGVIQ